MGNHQYYAIRFKKRGKWYYFAQYNATLQAYPSKERALEVIKDNKMNRLHAKVVPFPAHLTRNGL